MKPNEYKCDCCGEIFESEWTDEDAKAEAAENGFNDTPADEMCVVCDDCYREIME